ncbi:MAG: hypothetical protein KY431_03290 [Actinobacteria bacterium]|nr:hypothetical protein [Actinomycetota bacterium]
MENRQEGHDTSHVPGDDRTHEPAEKGGKNTKTLDSPLAEEDVHTPQQRDQSWTPGEATGPRREEPMRVEGNMAPPLDMPSELEDKLEQVNANPHSDAQETSDTQGEPRPLGGMPKTGSGEQDPGGQMGGGSQ